MHFTDVSLGVSLSFHGSFNLYEWLKADSTLSLKDLDARRKTVLYFVNLTDKEN